MSDSSFNIAVTSTWSAFKYNLVYLLGGRMSSYVGWDIPSNMGDYSLVDDGYMLGYGWADILTEKQYATQGDTSSDFKHDLDVLSDHTWIPPHVVTQDEAMAGNKSLNLFGLSFLPWNKAFLKNVTGDWVGKKVNSPDPTVPWIIFNPLRREVLVGKLRTIATLAAAGTLLWFGGKFAIKKYKQYQ